MQNVPCEPRRDLEALPMTDDKETDKDKEIKRLIIQEFLFDTPRYAEKKIKDLYGELLFSPLNVDGFCPYCKKMSTFSRRSGNVEIGKGPPATEVASRYNYWPFSLSCTRNSEHLIYYVLKFENYVVMKTGQFPQLALIAKDETRHFRTVLEEKDRD